MSDTQESLTAGIEPLEPAAVVRLRELINEVVDIDRALERLLPAAKCEDIEPAISELRNALDSRLCKSLNLLYGNDEEGN